MNEVAAAVCGTLVGGVLGIAIFWFWFRLWDAR